MNEQKVSTVRPRIGKYTITGRIGKGGMGMVYRGWDEILEREVAVKTLTLEKSLEDEHRQRFQIEAKAAAKLQHPNIVTVFELGEERGLPFIAMELLSGVDLEALLRSGEPMLLAEKLDVMAQVCRGLHYAHERHVIHRDMKPSNIRVLEDGTAKIMDFGIAKLGAGGVTKSGMMVGTVHYMSPEQIRGKTLDGRSDVFSVGVILYQLLTGERPFPGDHPTEILYKIVHNAAPPLAVDLGECGPPLQALLARALAKEADQRHPSAASLGEELSRIAAQHLRGGASPAEVSESVSASRRLVGEGRLEEGVRRLREVTDRHPDSVEAQRALRFATQEMKRRALAPEETAEEYPELAATFRPAPTRLQDAAVPPTTLLPPAPTVATSAPARSSAGGLLRWWWAGAAAVAALSLAVLAIRKPEAPAAAAGSVPPAPPIGGAPASPAAQPRPANRMTIKVTSDPAGAALSMDGQPVGVTPTSLSLDPTTPPRLTFAREGFHTREVRLEPNNIPAEVRVGLETSGPQGSVALSSSYPVDVFWRGRQLVTAEASKSFDLPAGEQTLTIVSKDNALRATMTVEVRGGETIPLTPPVLGRINIRANPDNCQVFIDGTFIDYPPILNRPLAGGAHTVSFRWPDGVNRDVSVDVSPGSPAYVMGRRD